MARKTLEKGTLRPLISKNNLLEQLGNISKEIRRLNDKALTQDSAEKAYQKLNQEKDVSGWTQQNVSAGQSAVTLTRWSLLWVDEIGFANDGSVTAVEVYSTAARTAGDLTIEVYIDGAASGFSVVLDSENTKAARELASIDEFQFSAGESIELKITTSGSWAPTSADIVCTITVALS